MTFNSRLRGGLPVALSLLLVCQFLTAPPHVLGDDSAGAKDQKSDQGNGTTQNGGNSPTKNSGKGGDKTQNSNSPSQNSSTAYFESQMLAYGAVDQIASRFVNHACGKLRASLDKQAKIENQASPDNPAKPEEQTQAETSVNIVLYDATTFANMQASGGFEANRKILTDQYNAIQRELSGGPKPAAAGALDIASLILQYSAASVTENNSGTVVIPDTAVRLSLLHYFSSHSNTSECIKTGLAVRVVYPLLGMSASQIESARTEIATELDNLLKLRASVEKSLADSTKGLPEANKTANDEISKRFTAINKYYDQLVSSLVTPDQTSGVVAAGPVIQGRALYDLLKAAKTYVVYEEFEAGGGTQHIRKNLYTNLISGDLISYSGGAVIGLALVQSQDSTIIFANTLRFRTPFTRIGKPTDSGGAKQGDNLSSLDD